MDSYIIHQKLIKDTAKQSIFLRLYYYPDVLISSHSDCFKNTGESLDFNLERPKVL